MSWKSYLKSRFRVIGIIEPGDQKIYRPKEGGSYVMAICLSKLSSDRNVKVGDTYPLFWPDSGYKCSAPNPPFETGETIASSVKTISYKNYSPDKFDVIGDFIPSDPAEYPTPSNNGSYKIATCLSKLKSDKKVAVGDNYVIIVYPSTDKVDAPNPPFETGESSAGSRRKIVYKLYKNDRFKITGNFKPSNPKLYPKPLNKGVYKIAICLSKLSKDRKAIVGGTYIIIEYPSSLKVDAPNPPFKTGE